MKNKRLVRRLILPSAPLALACASSAEAAIVYTDVPDLTIGTASGRIYWDMGTAGGTGSASTSLLALSDISLFFNINQSYVADLNRPSASVGGVGSYAYLSTTNAFATKFASGAIIGPSSFTSTSSANLTNNPGVTGNWRNDGSKGYLGLKFDGNDGPTTSYVYGWAKVSYNADRSLTLYDFAYETTGASIIAGAGAVPEPSVGAFASLLAGSAALYRRRRQNPDAAAA